MANKEAKHCYNAKEQYLPFLKVKSGYYQKDDPENGYPGENEIKDDCPQEVIVGIGIGITNTRLKLQILSRKGVHPFH